jgi:TonB family protein
MTTRLLLSNIASYGLQVLVLVAAAATLARVFRLEDPRAMLTYWRTLLLVCLVLPFGQPWHTALPAAVATATMVTTATGFPSAEVVVPPAPAAATWPVTDLVMIGLAIGFALRLLWLAIGACGLRRLWRDASPLDPLPESVRHAQERVVTRARMYVSHRVSGPMTFGLLRPVVVFPEGVSHMPAHVQEAITYHELLHVRRRDWLAEILEEAVRSVLWFHPAIWWLIGHIRLTREQVVDQEVIRLTDSRERYVDALLAIAVAGSRTAFTPASPFLRRHLLKKRVARILQENTMTTRRLIASLTTCTAALGLAATFAVRSFPLEAQGIPKADGGGPIQLVKGGEHLQHGELPEYPHRAIEQKVEGDVVVEMTLDDRGEVSDARVLSGPDELRKAALEAILQWHYSPAVLRSTVTQATLRFRVPADLKTAEAIEVVETHTMAPSPHIKAMLMEIDKALDDPTTTEAQRVELKAKQHEMRVMIEKIEAEREEPLDVELKMAPEDRAFKHGDALVGVATLIRSEKPVFEGQPRLVDVRTERVSEATAKELLAQAGVAIGDGISEDTAKQIRQIAIAMDEHFRVEFQKEKGGIVMTILTR